MDFDEDLLIGLGWNRERQSQLDALQDPTLVAARVVATQRGISWLLGAGGRDTSGGAVRPTRGAGRLGLDEAEWPVVGDWVAVRPAADGGDGVIHQVLPRTCLLARRRPGQLRAQPVAANLDVVIVVASAEVPPCLRRIERYLAFVRASGARALLVLNKSDLAADIDADLGALRMVAGDAVCVGASAASGAGLDDLRAQIGPGTTAALVGPSGVGKSSLINCLLGGERQATGAVRASDRKGRHTTTRRELHPLPGGGCLIDTPGMRELGLWDASAGVEQTFGEVAALAGGCRFRDCRHQGEPGCAVAAAVKDGRLDAARLASFEKLQREAANQPGQSAPRSQASGNARWKAIHKQQRGRRKVDPKLRED